MIAIKGSSFDPSVVSEFFELFKTPWEIFRGEATYDVVITDEVNVEPITAKLIVIMTRSIGVGNAGKPTGSQAPVSLVYAGETFPIYTGVQEVFGGEVLVTSVNSGQPIGNWVSKGFSVVVNLGYNFFSETEFLLSQGQPLEFAGVPTIDIHIWNLRRWILASGAELVEIPPLVDGRNFFACLTHDVDFGGIRNYAFDSALVGFLFRASIGSIVKFLKRQYSLKMVVRNWVAFAELPLVLWGLRPDYWQTFRQYRTIEKGRPSTFFLVPFVKRPGLGEEGRAPAKRAVKYDVAGLREDVLFLVADGCEIGVHGIDSWVDVDRGREEMEKICRIASLSRVGVRMHWLYFGPESPITLEDVGYLYDSTVGYNEIIGFRAGTSQVYRHLRSKQLLELPMHIMDTALFYPKRMGLTFSQGEEAIEHLLKAVTRMGGVVTVNWHDRSVGPERLWDGVYRWLLNEMGVNGARYATAGYVVEWFRKRRGVTFSKGRDRKSRVKVGGLAMDRADGMVLRIYKPSNRPPQLSCEAFSIPEFDDYLLGDVKEAEFVLAS